MNKNKEKLTPEQEAKIEARKKQLAKIEAERLEELQRYSAMTGKEQLVHNTEKITQACGVLQVPDHSKAALRDAIALIAQANMATLNVLLRLK